MEATEPKSTADILYPDQAAAGRAASGVEDDGRRRTGKPNTTNDSKKSMAERWYGTSNS